ncbi:conserved hypothetical protein [Vibrio harveyi]|uniref:hypothetical protein n=1 Tax=Vibrio harveyi group TaxID=717610 RepID=UPI001EFE24F8|nr:hypothetical protein [Vibrio harveyi]HCE3365253.1 hypothetical protein [Vibrio parahaemolyticus]MCG9236248.1 hypothetical protein [Vibrio harveyi]MCG9584867.1 hypothetical protein [Vibrio harveyi]CAH1217860.1 conserved hypothetical protein [Vibrio harveyi]CAH1552447.1 conserved hypothetical protein [Vibrio harveyi]
MSKLAVERLQEALDRLLEGKPERVKATGRLTLNKINREAGFGQSYIHKFKSFINETANPAIDEYNSNLNRTHLEHLSTSPTSVKASIVDKLKVDLKREENLKVKYRKERDDLNARVKELEGINNTLMYRLYELQEELHSPVYEMNDKKV